MILALKEMESIWAEIKVVILTMQNPFGLWDPDGDNTGLLQKLNIIHILLIEIASRIHALTDLTAAPHTLDADQAEVVSAGSGDRLAEHLLTDGALELFFW